MATGTVMIHLGEKLKLGGKKVTVLSGGGFMAVSDWHAKLERNRGLETLKL
jgi:hypothetical protein